MIQKKNYNKQIAWEINNFFYAVVFPYQYLKTQNNKKMKNYSHRKKEKAALDFLCSVFLLITATKLLSLRFNRFANIPRE